MRSARILLALTIATAGLSFASTCGPRPDDGYSDESAQSAQSAESQTEQEQMDEVEEQIDR